MRMLLILFVPFLSEKAAINSIVRVVCKLKTFMSSGDESWRGLRSRKKTCENAFSVVGGSISQ